MVRLGISVLLATLFAVPALADKPKDNKMAPYETKAFQLGMYRTIKGTAPLIDKCTQKYATEYPGRSGPVMLQYTIETSGRVKKSSIQTSLKNYDHLRSCLKDVIRQWRFPSPGTVHIKSTLKIIVAKGVKFDVLKPGEERKPQPKTEAPKPASRTAVQFRGVEGGNDEGVEGGSEGAVEGGSEGSVELGEE